MLGGQNVTLDGGGTLDGSGQVKQTDRRVETVSDKHCNRPGMMNCEKLSRASQDDAH